MANKYTADQIRGVISDYKKGEHNVKTLSQKHKMHVRSVRYYLEKTDKVMVRQRQVAKRRVKAAIQFKPTIAKKVTPASAKKSPVKVAVKAESAPVEIIKKEIKKPTILNPGQRQALLADRQAGMKIDDVAAKYDVSVPTVYAVMYQLYGGKQAFRKAESARLASLQTEASKPIAKKTISKKVVAATRKAEAKKLAVKKVAAKKTPAKPDLITSDKILADLSSQINTLVKNAFDKLSLSFANGQ